MIRITRLLWDEWNITHIARHDVLPDEVEQVCHGDVLAQQGHSGHMVLIGPTSNGRMLEVVLGPEGWGAYYVVTAHTASRKDRALYEAEKLGEKGGEER